MDFLRNYFVVLLTILLVFVLHISFTLGDKKLEPNYDFEHYKVLDLKQHLVLTCNVTDTSSTSSNAQVRWFKDDVQLKTTVVDGKTRIDISGNNMKIIRPNLDDVGMYSCQLFPPNATEPIDKADINVIAKPYVKLPHQLTFIEGEELKLECVITAKPVPVVMWKFGNYTYDKSSGRVELKQSENGIPNGIFSIQKSTLDDRGNYSCIAINTVASGINDKVTGTTNSFVRIKDKFAALWPFLGICVEVVVLCAVIFVYEKKRNKAELEESDTDQSPEQKNTPDHGKDSVRQRK